MRKIIVTEEKYEKLTEGLISNMLQSMIFGSSSDSPTIAQDAMSNTAPVSPQGQGFVGNVANYIKNKLAGNNNNAQQQNQVQQGQAQPTIQGGRIGNWNVAAACNHLMRCAGATSNHKCATYVENAIAAGGVRRMNCRENGGDGWALSLHTRGILKKHGWNIIHSGTSQGYATPEKNLSLQNGDVCVMGVINGGRKQHVTMYANGGWYADFRQKRMLVYQRPTNWWIYRYSGRGM